MAEAVVAAVAVEPAEAGAAVEVVVEGEPAAAVEPVEAAVRAAARLLARAAAEVAVLEAAMEASQPGTAVLSRPGTRACRRAV